MNWKKALLPMILTLPLIIVLALGFGHDPHAVPSVLEGRNAPRFQLKSLAGEEISLEGMAGKPLLLNFWSTWCEPCKLEHGLLQQAASRYAGRVQFVGIVYQDSGDKVRQYLTRHPSAYPHLLDPDSKVAIDFGIAGVPESFIIDAQGTIVHKQTGVMTPDVLQAVLDPLAQDPLGGAP